MSDAPALEPLDESTFDTVLCVAAHPDDLEYGTNAAVATWTAAALARSSATETAW